MMGEVYFISFLAMLRKEFSMYNIEDVLDDLEKHLMSDNASRAYSAAASLTRRIPLSKLTKPVYDGIYALDERSKSAHHRPTTPLLQQGRLNKNRVGIVEMCLQWFRGTTMHLISIMNADVDNLPIGLHVPHFEHLTDFARDEMCLYFSVHDLILDLQRSLRDDNELTKLRIEIKQLKKEKHDLWEAYMDFSQRLKNACEETKQVKESLARMQKETRTENESNSYLRQEADRYKQGNNIVKEGFRKTVETMTSAQERIDHLERELKDEQRQLANAKLELQQSLGNNDDLKNNMLKLRQVAERYKQERDRVKEELEKAKEETTSFLKCLNDAREETKQVKKSLSHVQNETENESYSKFREEADQYKQERDRVTKELRTTKETLSLARESILKLRLEAERYKQERDIVKEELQKANEKTISSQKGIAHLQKNLKEQYLQLDSVKLELRQTREENKDLQNRLENAQKETNELKESFSRVQKEKRTEDERWSTLKGEAEQYKQERDYVKEELRKAIEKTISSRERIAQLEQKLEEQHRQLANVESELRQTQENKEVLQNSQVTAAQLTHENQSIAELSDVNRPTKLAERLSELYDNEWTDAFKAIEDDPTNVASEEDIAKKLKDILRNCFEKCVDISNQQLANIEATLFNPGSGKHTSSSRQLTPKQAMTITDLRRETSIFSTEHIKQEMCRQFQYRQYQVKRPEAFH